MSLPPPVVVPPSSLPLSDVLMAEKMVQQVNEVSSSDPSTPSMGKSPSKSSTSSLATKFEAIWPKKRSRPGGYESERGSSVEELPSQRLYCETDWQLKRRKLRLKKLELKGGFNRWTRHHNSTVLHSKCVSDLELARGLEIKVHRDIVDACKKCKKSKGKRGKKQLIPEFSKKGRSGNATGVHIISRSGSSVNGSFSLASDQSCSINQAKDEPSSAK